MVCASSVSPGCLDKHLLRVLDIKFKQAQGYLFLYPYPLFLWQNIITLGLH